MKYFGTDGIRGKAEMFSDGLLKRFVVAICSVAKNKVFIIGRDTRVSGKELEGKLTKLLVDAGAVVKVIGVVPTPVCAFLTKELGAEYGIMLSASHNPPEFNGIKLFNGRAEKLTEEEEMSLDGLISQDLQAVPEAHGYFTFIENAVEIYINRIVKRFGTCLKGLHVFLDTANGATSECAPRLFNALGADVTVINDEVNGININVKCGATYDVTLLKAMCGGGYDIGFAYDGDGDRVIAAKNGKVFDGDHLMYILAKKTMESGKLKNRGVVMSILGNYGVEEALNRCGIAVERTAVGDKYIAERMRDCGYIFGSEAGGHVICGEYLPTGDGIMTSALVAQIACSENIEIIDDIVERPQFSEGIITGGKDEKRLLSEFEKTGIVDAFDALGIRSVVRKSGTENKIRVMCECGSEVAAKTALMAEVSVLKYIQNIGLEVTK